jgi:hypothetical protein
MDDLIHPNNSINIKLILTSKHNSTNIIQQNSRILQQNKIPNKINHSNLYSGLP